MPKSPTWSDFISPQYLGEQRRLHLKPEGYGGRGSKWAKVVADIIESNGCESVLDYGCGQGTLREAVMFISDISERVTWRNYDPAMSAFESVPDPAVQTFDLVVCTDMLEHVEPEKIERVLTHMRRLVGDSGLLFTVISTVPTAKTLSDGRQAHILLHDGEWWERIMEEAKFEAIAANLHEHNPKPEKQIIDLWRPV